MVSWAPWSSLVFPIEVATISDAQTPTECGMTENTCGNSTARNEECSPSSTEKINNNSFGTILEPILIRLLSLGKKYPFSQKWT